MARIFLSTLGTSRYIPCPRNDLLHGEWKKDGGSSAKSLKDNLPGIMNRLRNAWDEHRKTVTKV